MTTRRQILALTALGALAGAGLNATSNAQTTQAQTGTGRLPQVTLQTSMGNIIVEVDIQNAPTTGANFLQYVREGFYDGTIFHRVIGNFMIQGGGFAAGMKEKDTNTSIQNEAQNGLKNDKYTIAMARTSESHSASAQFFINVKNNDFLNHSSPTPQGWGYAVFGKVVEGTDVVDAIKGVATGNKGFHQDVPVEDVVIEKATVLNS